MYPQLEVDPELTERATKVRLLAGHRDTKDGSGAASDDKVSKKASPPPSKWRRALLRHVPVLQWLPAYNMEWGIDDVIAGITLGLTIIPESIACALLAGLPARYGLCSAFIGPLIYLIFGSIDKVIIGPTSLVALVSVQFTVGRPIEFAFLLTFLSGIVQIIMGSMHMGEFQLQQSKQFRPQPTSR